MLVVANFANTKSCKKAKKWLKPWHMGIHLKVRNGAIQRIPTWQGLKHFQKSLQHCALDKDSLSIGRVYDINPSHHDERYQSARIHQRHTFENI